YEYSSPPENHYYGYKYVCLRPEFYAYSFKAKINKNVKNILISFGGTDEHNLTYKVLDMIREYNIKSPKYIVILGLGYGKNKLNKLKTLINVMKKENFKVTLLKDVRNMAEVMLSADFAITSNGRTVYELAALGIPTITIAQNERETTHLFSYMCNGIVYLGLYSSIKNKKFIIYFKKMFNFKYRKKMMNNLKQYSKNIRKGYQTIIDLTFSKYNEVT
ncbi:hypothetical protein J7J90_01105, partial [Candidatus Micrarchaeota archaeon]|nr:hypothetical protein [Candidatus Micrarchaeota archaeon]